MSMIVATFENGQLVTARADDYFRYHDQERTMVEEDGNVEGPVGHFTLREVTTSTIADYVSEHGDPWLSETRNFEPGWYIDVRGEDGTIWAFAYGSNEYTMPEEAARKDFAEAVRVHSEWQRDHILKDLNHGERAMLKNNLKELRAEALALYNEVDGPGPIEVDEDSLVWNLLGVIAGNTANVKDILFGDGPSPIE